MAWLRQLLDWQQETSDPGEFLESLRFEINASEVYVFTPKGQLVGLPAVHSNSFDYETGHAWNYTFSSDISATSKPRWPSKANSHAR